MPLPHYTQLDTRFGGINVPVPLEPVWVNLFECSFVLPTILQAQGRNAAILMPQAVKVTGLDLTQDLDEAEQRYKYSTRVFLGMPKKTHVNFDIEFQINVTKKGQMEAWNTLKAWYDLSWNSQDGTLHYKSDVVGASILNQHDKKGYILRRVTLQNTQLKGVTTPEFNWSETTTLVTANAKFVADYFVDEYIDNKSLGGIINVYG